MVDSPELDGASRVAGIRVGRPDFRRPQRDSMCDADNLNIVVHRGCDPCHRGTVAHCVVSVGGGTLTALNDRWSQIRMREVDTAVDDEQFRAGSGRQRPGSGRIDAAHIPRGRLRGVGTGEYRLDIFDQRVRAEVRNEPRGDACNYGGDVNKLDLEAETERAKLRFSGGPLPGGGPHPGGTLP